MGTLFAMELKEVHPECGTHYELWVDHGVPFVYCPKCDKSWEPCDSAWAQYKAAYGSDPLSQKLGVARRTISDWLSGDGCHHTEAEIANIPQSGDNRLAVATAPRYLVVCQSVEKFRPPDGITFPLIIAVRLSAS